MVYGMTWKEPHKCPPLFYFRHENWGEELQEIRATDFEDAAERFAKMYNEEDGEYCLLNEEEDVIISDGKIEKKFIVSAEQSVDYSVSEVEEEEDGNKSKS